MPRSSDLRFPRSNSAFPLRLSLNPYFPILEELLLPDRDNLLQPVDRILARVERRAAVRRRDDDRDTRLANVHMAEPVNDRDTADIPRGPHELSNFLHGLERHRLVGFILEIACRLPLGVVPHDTFEDTQSAILWS